MCVRTHPTCGVFKEGTYQVENRHLHHTLVEVCRAILDYLDCDDFLRLQVLALNDLPKCALAQYIQDQIPIPI